jgi:Trp operon repressor
MSPELLKEISEELLIRLSAAKEPDSADSLLTMILTPHERRMIAIRLCIIDKLVAGQTYDEIRSDLRVSPETIARVRLAAYEYIDQQFVDRIAAIPDSHGFVAPRMARLDRLPIYPYSDFFWADELVRSVLDGIARAREKYH